MSLLGSIIDAVGKTAQAGVQAYAYSSPKATVTKRGRARKKKSGCTPCAAFNQAEETRERARTGQL